jgi:hypothetical protein
MGIEGFIFPWLIAMSIVALLGSASLAQRFGFLPPDRRHIPSGDRDAGFWIRQTIKVVIVGFAAWQIAVILTRVM